MATHVKWKFPKREEDKSVHISWDREWTLCGLAFEGNDGSVGKVYGEDPQEFIETNRKVTCDRCISIVHFCKNIKETELKKDQ